MPTPQLPSTHARTPAGDASVLSRWGLVALMAVGSVVMWFGVPLGLVYLVSHTVQTTQPTMGPYLLVVLGAPIGMTIVGRALGALDRRYGALTARVTEHHQAEWMKSVRGARSSTRWEVLDVVMVISVCTALAITGVWFVFFAHASV